MFKPNLASACAIPLLISSSALAQISPDPYSLYVDEEGKMTLPADLLTNWELIGMNGLMAEDKTSVVSLHSVFTQPEAAKYFKDNGQFADGTILIKEIRNAKMTTGTTGLVGYSDDVDVWFMMVKDTQGRFEGNADWGSGWGWALFSGDDMTTNTSRGWEQECMGCHLPVKEQDWVHSSHYPGLNK